MTHTQIVNKLNQGICHILVIVSTRQRTGYCSSSHWPPARCGPQYWCSSCTTSTWGCGSGSAGGRSARPNGRPRTCTRRSRGPPRRPRTRRAWRFWRACGDSRGRRWRRAWLTHPCGGGGGRPGRPWFFWEFWFVRKQDRTRERREKAEA